MIYSDPSRKSEIDAGFDVVSLSQSLDAIHLRTYYLHGPWENTVNHHAPLDRNTAGDQLTVDFEYDLRSYDLQDPWENMVNNHTPHYLNTAEDQLTVDFA